jgi:hypothetical protein
MYFRSPSQSLAHDRNLTSYYKSLQEQQARGELQDGLILPTSPAAAQTVADAAARYDMLATDLSDTLLHEPYSAAAGAAAAVAAAATGSKQHGQQQQPTTGSGRQRRRTSSSNSSVEQQHQQQRRRQPGTQNSSGGAS